MQNVCPTLDTGVPFDPEHTVFNRDYLLQILQKGQVGFHIYNIACHVTHRTSDPALFG